MTAHSASIRWVCLSCSGLVDPDWGHSMGNETDRGGEIRTNHAGTLQRCSLGPVWAGHCPFVGGTTSHAYPATWQLPPVNPAFSAPGALLFAAGSGLCVPGSPCSGPFTPLLESKQGLCPVRTHLFGTGPFPELGLLYSAGQQGLYVVWH